MLVSRITFTRTRESYSLPAEGRARRLNPDSVEDIEEGAQALAAGGVLSVDMFGTQGFVCDGTNEAAVDRIFEIKQRSRDRKLVTATPPEILEELADLEKIHPVFREQLGIGDWQWFQKIQDYLPAHVIFPLRADVSLPEGIVTIDEDTNNPTVAGFWWRGHLLFRSLLSELRDIKSNAVLSGSSAGFSGQEPCRTADEVSALFGDQIYGVFERTSATPFSFREPHTIIRLPQAEDYSPLASVLRLGGVHPESLVDVFQGMIHIPEDEDIGIVFNLERLETVTLHSGVEDDLIQLYEELVRQSGMAESEWRI